MNTHKNHDALQGTPSPLNLMPNFYDLVSSEKSPNQQSTTPFLMNTHKNHDALQGTPSPLNLMPNFYDLVSSEDSSSPSSDLLDRPRPEGTTKGECAKTCEARSQHRSLLYPNKLCKELFIDKYEVLPVVLGAGTYGCVQECKNKKTGETFAVKFIRKKFGANHSDSSIRREIEALRTVNHAGVIKMIDSYEDYEYLYIVMEMCSGGNLHGRVAEKGHLSEKEATQIIKQLLEVVQYLHSHDIVHRDIKTENIMFESRNGANDYGALKLVDFGMATKHKQGTAPMSSYVGTRVFMSPEVIMGNYDRSCDLWSIGVTTYLMLSGRLPFEGHTRQDILKLILRDHLDFSGPNWRNVSLMAKNFISCLLQVDPQKRYTAEQALHHPWIDPTFLHKQALSAQTAAPSSSAIADHDHQALNFNGIHTKRHVKKARALCSSKFVSPAVKMTYLSQMVQTSKTAIRRNGDVHKQIYCTRLNKHQPESAQTIVVIE